MHVSRVKLVRKWGGHTSDALLDPNCLQFTVEGLEGFIGYLLEGNCAVVLGDPVSAPQDFLPLTQAFTSFCKKSGLSIVYLTVSDLFTSLVFPSLCPVKIHFGEEITLNPQLNPKDLTGEHAALVRRKTRSASERGVSIQELCSKNSSSIEQQMEALAMDWVMHRKGAQIHISEATLFHNRQGKRWFYAEHNQRIIGTAVLNERKQAHGWHLNHLMTSADAPKGTSELLIVRILEMLKNENYSFVSCGIAPKKKLEKIEGLSFLPSLLTQGTYFLAQKWFHLDKHEMFWKKFTPLMQPSYLLFSHASIGIQEVRAIAKATHASF